MYFQRATRTKDDFVSNSSPLEFFSLFMDDVVLKMLVDGTNEHARMVMSVNKPLTHVDYRRQIVASLCDGLVVGDVRRQLMHPTRLDECFQGRHYVERGTKQR